MWGVKALEEWDEALFTEATGQRETRPASDAGLPRSSLLDPVVHHASSWPPQGWLLPCHLQVLANAISRAEEDELQAARSQASSTHSTELRLGAMPNPVVHEPCGWPIVQGLLYRVRHTGA